ncbi:MAG: DUF5719 family protein [Nocardioides sp.]
MSETPRTNRANRASRRPLDITFVLAVAVPLLVALALFLTNPGFGSAYFHQPTTPPLDRSVVVCPGSVGDGDQVTVGATGAGEASVADRSVDLPTHGAALADSDSDPVVITATGAAAPGLVATRSSTSPVAASACITPRADQWFTGVGAGPTHNSYVVLVNPNPGPAVADLTVLGDTGPIDVPALRGIAVPGRDSQIIDLGAVMPTQSALALHAVVERGQVAVSVRDRAAHLVGNAQDEDWLPAQGAPARDALLLGLAAGDGSRLLTVANPTDREITASVRLVSANSVFTPDDAPTLDIGPQSVSRVDLAHVLGSAKADGVVGVEVSASGTVTASLRSLVGGDVSLLAPSSSSSAATTVVVPRGEKDLVVGGAGAVGALTVVARDASGKELASKRVALSPQQGLTVPLPSGAVRVDVTPERTSFRGSVLVHGAHGLAVVPLRAPRLTSRVPFVKPGLPR